MARKNCKVVVLLALAALGLAALGASSQEPVATMRAPRVARSVADVTAGPDRIAEPSTSSSSVPPAIRMEAIETAVTPAQRETSRAVASTPEVDCGHDHRAPDDGSIPEVVAEDPIRSTWLPEAIARRLDQAGDRAIRAVARRAIPAAAQLMKTRNPARPIEPAMREQLRPTFGDLVDRVLVCDEAELPDDVLHTEGVEALTIGDRIYVRGELRADDPAHVRLLAHEMVHARQFDRFGRDLPAFSEELARQLAAARWDEEQTEFEREANGLVLVEPRRGGLAGTLGELARER